MTKQKKPKTGDVVGWAVVDKHWNITELCGSREFARKSITHWNHIGYPGLNFHRIAKIVLAK